MVLLILFAFIAGFVTVLSPCILPLLPVILSSSADASGKQRPLGIILGFIFSFTFFTLFLASLVKISGIDASSFRLVSVFILGIFGLSLLLPPGQASLELLFARLASFTPTTQNKHGFTGGLIIGFSLGLLWTPCVGPILASVISLALAGEVTAQATLITIAYASGTAIPLFGVMLVGNKALQSAPGLANHAGNVQKIFGVVMILTALAIYFGLDRRFQAYVLEVFPNYSHWLTQLEQQKAVDQALDQLSTEE